MLQIAEQNGGQLSATLYYKYGFDGSGSHHRAIFFALIFILEIIGFLIRFHPWVPLCYNQNPIFPLGTTIFH